jgi:hypothetical protein
MIRSVTGYAQTPRLDAAGIALRVLFGLLLVVVTLEVMAVLTMAMAGGGPSSPVSDYANYIAATHRWVEGGSFYQPYQLTGPYTVALAEIMYPPTVIPLLVPFTVLPSVLWWLAPIAILGAVFAYWRPSLIGWVLILACLASPFTTFTYAAGNPAMWFVALLGLGTIYHWPSVFVLLKPTLAPFALVGIRHRSWWVALAVLALTSLVFLPLWLDYSHVFANARGSLVSPLYSWSQFPLMLTPLIARWSSDHHRE